MSWQRRTSRKLRLMPTEATWSEPGLEITLGSSDQATPEYFWQSREAHILLEEHHAKRAEEPTRVTTSYFLWLPLWRAVPPVLPVGHLCQGPDQLEEADPLIVALGDLQQHHFISS